jgi:hypothetical protein
MKLPKVLLNSIAIGLTASAFLACGEEVVSPRADNDQSFLLNAYPGSDCPNINRDPCPACGLG